MRFAHWILSLLRSILEVLELPLFLLSPSLSLFLPDWGEIAVNNRNEVRTCRKSRYKPSVRYKERRLIRVASFNSGGWHMVAFGRAVACARLTLRHSRRQAICGFCHLPIIIRCIHPVCASSKPLSMHRGARSRSSFRPRRLSAKPCRVGAQWSNCSRASPERWHVATTRSLYFYYYGYCFRSWGTGRHGSAASEEHPAEGALSIIGLSSRCS